MRKSFTFLAASAFLLPGLPSVAQTNKALNLNGSNYVAANSPAILTTASTGEFTIEFWAYIDIAAMDGVRHQFVSQGEGTSDFYIGYDGGTGSILVGDFYNGSVPMPTNQWTHIALTYDGGTSAALYLNGVLADPNVFLFWSQTGLFRIGANSSLTERAVAKIDELKVWNSQRSPFSIKQDVLGSPDPGDADLEFWLDMSDDGSGVLANKATQYGSLEGDINGTGPNFASSPIASNTNALNFDQSGPDNNLVMIPNSASYDQIFDANNNKGGTVEFYVNTSSLSSSFTTIISRYGHFRILMSNTQIRIDDGKGTTPADYTLDLGDFPLGFQSNPDPWAHLAFVYNGGNNVDIYYNGQPFGPASSVNYTFNGSTVPGMPITLGVTQDDAATNSSAFTGGIDEVRIWKSQRTSGDIGTYYGTSLNGTDPDLISQYTFDEGVPGQDNTGLTLALDNSGGNHATLSNFVLNGTVSNFTDHLMTVQPISLPVTLTKFTAQRSGSGSLLNWQTAQEQNSKEFAIERSTDGKNFITIGIVRAAGFSDKLVNYTFTDLTPSQGKNYYRLKQSDMDVRFTYSDIRLLNFNANNQLAWYPSGKQSATVTFWQGNNEAYSVSTSSGQLIRQGRFTNGRTELTDLTPGVYFVRVVTKTGDAPTTKILILQ